MTMIFMDGFDYYTVAQAIRKWTQQASISSMITGRLGTGQAMRLHGTGFGSSIGVRKDFGANYATLIAGHAFNFPFSGYAGPGQKFLQLLDNGSIQCAVGVANDGTGHLIAYYGSAGSSTSSVGFPSGWNYVEVKALIHPSAGTIEVKLNGVSIIALTGINTRATANNYVNGLFLASDSNASTDRDFDDVYVCDTSGSRNNDFLGDIRVDTLFPNAASASGGHTMWTRGGTDTGANWDQVNDATSDDDTTYVKSATPNDIDTYAFTDMASGAGSVLAVQLVTTARKDDAGSRTFAPVIRQAGADQVGTTQVLTLSYQQFLQIFETNPHTSAPWTPSELNADEFGYKLIA